MLTVNVPTSIGMSKVRDLVQAFGLEVNDLLSFSISLQSVTAEVLARDEDGNRFLDGGEIAVHRIAIPIDRDT